MIRIIGLIFILFLPSVVLSSPIKWTFSPDAHLIAGGTVSGYFYWDANNNQASNANLVYTPNGGSPITMDTVTGGSQLYILVTSSSHTSGTTALNINLNYNQQSTLTNSGGTQYIVVTAGTCGDVACSTYNANVEGMAGNTPVVALIPQSVPVLSEWAKLLLIISIIVVMGWNCRQNFN